MFSNTRSPFMSQVHRKTRQWGTKPSGASWKKATCGWRENININTTLEWRRKSKSLAARSMKTLSGSWTIYSAAKQLDGGGRHDYGCGVAWLKRRPQITVGDAHTDALRWQEGNGDTSSFWPSAGIGLSWCFPSQTGLTKSWKSFSSRLENFPDWRRLYTPSPNHYSSSLTLLNNQMKPTKQLQLSHWTNTRRNINLVAWSKSLYSCLYYCVYYCIILLFSPYVPSGK